MIDLTNRSACAFRLGERAGKLDHEEHVEGDETPKPPHLDHKEVARSQNIPVGAKELLPRDALAALRCRLDAVAFENVGDGRSGDPGRLLDGHQVVVRVRRQDCTGVRETGRRDRSRYVGEPG